MDELRSKGLEKMSEVYGWEMISVSHCAKLDGVVTKVVGRRKKAAEKGEGRDTAEERRANVNAALHMHSESSLDDK